MPLSATVDATQIVIAGHWLSVTGMLICARRHKERFVLTF